MTGLGVLHVNSESGWRGGEAQTLYLAAGLVSRGNRSLVAARPGSPLLEKAAAAGLETSPLPVRGAWDLGAARRLARLVRVAGIDVVHCHTAHAAGLGTLASLIGPRRRMVASRRVSFPLRGGLLGRLRYSWRVDRVIAVSGAIRRSLIAQGIPADRVVVVHSGIDPERFARGDRARFRDALREARPAWPPDAVVAGTVGHLAAHKGFDLFLDGAARAASAVPALRFVIVGRGEREESLRARATRLGIADRVLFMGFREDVPDVLAGLDLFVLASHSGEGSPAAIKEAMAAGAPVVATALDGVEEIIEDARTGLLTPPGDAPALARAMIGLAGDAGLRARLADGGRRRVGEFTIDRMVEKTAAVYRSLGGVR